MGFERVRREYGARLLFFFCVAFCLFSIVYRLSSQEEKRRHRTHQVSAPVLSV